MDMGIEIMADAQFIIWLPVAERLNTSNMLKTRIVNIGQNHVFPLCDSGQEETVEHLSFKCSFIAFLLSRLDIKWTLIHDRLDLITQAKDLYFRTLYDCCVGNMQRKK
jgi:hypothetical protein